MTHTEPISDVSWRALFTREHFPKLGVMCLAVWLHAANSMLAATTMPTAVEEIGGLHLINWAFALYLTGSIISGVSVSLLILKVGFKSTMIYAAVIYGLGCVLCAIAPSMWILLIGRTIQGLGGGALVALVYVSQDRFFPNKLVPKIVAIVSIVWMIAACVGPIVGGTFATLGIWRMAFWVFFAQAFMMVIAVGMLITADQSHDNIDADPIPIIRLIFLAGAVLLISLAGAQFHVIYSPILIAAGLTSLGLFILRDRMATRSKMLSPQIIDINHPVGAGLMTTFLLCISIMQFLIYGPFILIHLFGVTPFQAGLIVILETIGWTTGAIILSGVSHQHERLIIRSGSAGVALGMVAMAYILPVGPIWLIMTVAFLSNIGFGMMWGFIIRRTVAAAPAGEKDRTSGALPTTQQLGFAIGAAFCGVVANGLGLSDESSYEEIQRVAFWIFAVMVPVTILGNITAWKFTQNTVATDN